MRCYGEFKDDRMCDMCQLIDARRYAKCIEETKTEEEKRKLHIEKMDSIRNRCKFRERCWDEYTPFWGCTKNGWNGNMTCNCKPSAECEQYCSAIKKET